MASALQGKPGGEGNATQKPSAAIPPALGDNPAHISPSTCNKGKRRRRFSSGGIQGSPSNIRGPKVAGVIRRATGKPAQKAGSWDAKPSPSKERFDKSIQEGRDPEAEPRMFTRALSRRFANDIRCSLKGRRMI